MKRVLTGLVLLIYLLISVIAVLASPTNVTSNPALFSLIKTETSKNNTVTVHGDRLSFDFGKGLGGNTYGFQPNSIYSYNNLFKVKNITSDNLTVWYTLDGHLKEFNDEGNISLNIPDAAGSKWYPGQAIVLSADAETGGIGFIFTIPAKQQLGSYSGSITIHAAQEAADNTENLIVPVEDSFPEDEPDKVEPGTDEGAGGIVIPVSNNDDTPAGDTEKPAILELAMAPEAPQTALLGDDLYFNLSNWPYLLLIPLPLLLWFLLSRRVLILIPVEENRFKVAARKIARRRNKQWFVNVEKELDKHLAGYGQIVVDFRGGFLKKADKSVYAGEFILGSSELRYAQISSKHNATWTDRLQQKKYYAVG